MDHDIVLRDILKRSLESKGVLSQIRASLRASVFTCLDEQERASGVYVPNPTALAVKHDSAGLLALQIVVDFLTHFELVKTLSVLKTETNMGEGDVLPRADLVSVMGIGDREGAPAIIQLIERKCQRNGVIKGEVLKPKASLSKRTGAMYSTKANDKSPSPKEALVNVRVRSTGAKRDRLATPGSMMSSEEEKGNGEGLYVNERMDGDGEKARSTDLDSNCIESSAGDDEGVRTRQINEDTINSTGLKDEGPSLEHAPLDIRARSPGAQPDLLCTSGKTMLEGEDKGNGDGLSVNESVIGSEEQAVGAALDSSFSESSAGDDDEGVRTRQINEDTINSTGLKDEGPSLEHAPLDIRARSPGAQPDLLCTSGRTMLEAEGSGNGDGLSINESVIGSEEQAISAALDSSFSESSAGDDDEGVRTRQINKDTMHSTEFEDEGLSIEYTPFDERAYDFVEQASSTGTQLDMIPTPASSMSKGKNKNTGEVLSVNESVNGSEERALSTAVGSNRGESSAGDDDEGVCARQINEDTMHSTEFEDEDPSFEHTPFDERAYDFVEQARSPGAQSDLLSTSGSTMPKGEDKGNGDGLSVNESVIRSEERAFSTDVGSSCIESSAGNDEGVCARQINEGNGMIIVTRSAAAPASRSYESEPLATSSPPYVPYSSLRIESERFSQSEGASNGGVDFDHAEEIRVSPEGDGDGNKGRTRERVKVESARLGTDETGEDGERLSSTGSDVGVPEEIIGMDLSSGGELEVQGESHVIMEEDHSLEEILFEATLSEISDQDQGRKADANWEFMDGVSADSSFSVDVRGALDDEGFDFEDAQSV